MTTPATVLLCPKCTSEMRTYERNGVTVDQCTSCKGIFLDRGELDRLIDAEGSFYNAGNAAAAAPQAPPTPYRENDRYDDDRRHGYGGGKRRKSFLGELFD